VAESTPSSSFANSIAACVRSLSRERLGRRRLGVEAQLGRRLRLPVGVGIGELDLPLRQDDLPAAGFLERLEHAQLLGAVLPEQRLRDRDLASAIREVAERLPTASYSATGSRSLKSLTLMPMAASAAPAAFDSSSTPTSVRVSLLAAAPMLSMLTPAVAPLTASEASDSAVAPVLSSRSLNFAAPCTSDSKRRRSDAGRRNQRRDGERGPLDRGSDAPVE
jgi:hypothetical protein